MSKIFLKTKECSISYDTVYETRNLDRSKLKSFGDEYRIEVITHDGMKYLTDDQSINLAEWLSRETVADPSGRFKLVDAYVANGEKADEEEDKFVINVYDIIGWKYFRHLMLPLVVSPRYLGQPWEIIDGGLLQTATGEVFEMKGHRQRYDSIDAYVESIRKKHSSG